MLKTIIPFLPGHITLYRNGKVYVDGDYVKISKSYLTQGKYIVVYDNGKLSGTFTIKG